MKKLLTILLAAVMTAALTYTAWGTELPFTVEIPGDAVMEGVTEEERDLIVDLLELIPGSGVLEMLTGTFVQTDPELAKGVFNDLAGRRELEFKEGFVPREDPEKPEKDPENMRLTRITKTPEFMEAAFSCTYEGVKTAYKCQIRITEENGIKKCALMKIWLDEDELETVEAVSEVFEDFFEEVIEPLY